MAFENHVAKIVVNNRSVLVLDWRDKNGSSEYYIRYIVDKEIGSLIIQGDLGFAVACWYNKLDPRSLAGYVKNIGYFTEKLQCSTDKYTYDDDDIKSDVYQYFDDIAVGYEGDELREVIDDCQYIIRAITDAKHNNDGLDDEARRILEKYDPDWWENPYLGNAGRRVAERVKLWADGYARAVREVL